MKPVEFPEMNVTFTAPGCEPLPTFADGTQIVSCWELTEEERQKIAEGGHLYLHIFGSQQPAVALSAGFPFVDKTEWPDEVEATDH
jgi:hypothetical protein